MALAQRALLHHVLNGLGQREQPQRIGNGGAGTAHPCGDLLLGQRKLLHQTAVAPRLLHGVEVFPLQILNEGHLEHPLVLQLLELNRQLGQPGQPGRAPAPLPGQQLIPAVSHITHQQGLQHAVAGDGVGKLLQLLLVKLPAGLVLVGLNG